jgi:hypothetical protein
MRSPESLIYLIFKAQWRKPTPIIDKRESKSLTKSLKSIHNKGRKGSKQDDRSNLTITTIISFFELSSTFTP